METIHGLNTHGPAIIGTGVLFTVLSVVAVGLRFTSKRVTQARVGVDDWLLLVALLIFVTAEVLVIRCMRSIKLLDASYRHTKHVFTADIVGRQATSPDDERYQTYIQVRNQCPCI